MKNFFLLILLTLNLPVSAQVTIVDGDDWSIPAWSQALDDYRFYSEELSPAHNVNVHVIDLSWRQINPQMGVFSRNNTGSAAGMTFASLDDQLALPGKYWLRIWVSGEDWAPAWVKADCGITTTWPDHDNQANHLPIWDACVWGHIKNMYRQVLTGWNLAADSNMLFSHVPGAFYYTEFDFDVAFKAAASNDLTFNSFNSWFHSAMPELVAIANGENASTEDDYAWKLVYTGEDFPFDDTWNGATNLFAKDAVQSGMGIRNGITELFNFHLNHTPAYGAHIAQDGHIVIDENWPLLTDKRIIGAENECYNACGYTAQNLFYAIKMSNFKALQMRTKNLYVVPDDSYLDAYPQHWSWVRDQLGKQRTSAADAWAVLRTAKDQYWADDTSHTWTGAPWVNNLERWLVQKDISPDGLTQQGTEHHSNELDTDNAESWEGRRTHRAQDQDYLYFYVDDVFASDNNQQWQLKVTYLDSGSAQWRIEYSDGSSIVHTESVVQSNSGLSKTATFNLNNVQFNNSMTASADFRIFNGGNNDIEVYFVRLIRTTEPQYELIFQDHFE